MSAVPPRGEASADRLRRVAESDPVFQRLQELGLVERDMGGGKYSILCPFEEEHSDQGRAPGDGDAAYFLPHTNGYPEGGFFCFHSHHAVQSYGDYLAAIGIEAELSGFFGPDSEAQDGAELRPIEYVVDGFLSAGVTYIAGGHGVGKSSLLVPLASMVAGELQDSAGDVRVELPRRVIYITEDPDQARRLRYGLRKHKGLVDRGQFEIWQARRVKADGLESYLERIVEEHTLAGPNGYAVKPLVVFDTSNACFEIDNENDASQVGRVMSALKSAGNPVWIVGHIAKALMRKEVSEQTGRGSGAWEADAQATAFIFTESDDSARYMATRKLRFEPEYREIKLMSQVDEEDVMTPWGSVQRIPFRYGVPEVSDPKIRAEEKAKQNESADMAIIADTIWANGNEGVSKNWLEKEVKDFVPQHRARKAMAAMMKLGVMVNDAYYVDSSGKKRSGGLKMAGADPFA